MCHPIVAGLPVLGGSVSSAAEMKTARKDRTAIDAVVLVCVRLERSVRRTRNVDQTDVVQSAHSLLYLSTTAATAVKTMTAHASTPAQEGNA